MHGPSLTLNNLAPVTDKTVKTESKRNWTAGSKNVNIQSLKKTPRSSQKSRLLLINRVPGSTYLGCRSVFGAENCGYQNNAASTVRCGVYCCYTPIWWQLLVIVSSQPDVFNDTSFNLKKRPWVRLLQQLLLVVNPGGARIYNIQQSVCHLVIA